jgi:hypothetical protein
VLSEPPGQRRRVRRSRRIDQKFPRPTTGLGPQTHNATIPNRIARSLTDERLNIPPHFRQLRPIAFLSPLLALHRIRIAAGIGEDDEPHHPQVSHSLFHTRANLCNCHANRVSIF